MFGPCSCHVRFHRIIFFSMRGCGFCVFSRLGRFVRLPHGCMRFTSRCFFSFLPLLSNPCCSSLSSSFATLPRLPLSIHGPRSHSTCFLLRHLFRSSSTSFLFFRPCAFPSRMLFLLRWWWLRWWRGRTREGEKDTLGVGCFRLRWTTLFS